MNGIRLQLRHNVAALLAIALMGSVLVVLHFTETAKASDNGFGGGDWVGLSPSYRIADTSSPAQPFNRVDETRTYNILDKGGVPAEGVEAVAVTIAVTQTNTRGNVSMWAAGEKRPATSNITFAPASSPDSNTALVPVGPDGHISLAVSQTAVSGTPLTTNVTADVTGYFTENSTSSGSGFVSVNPTRVIDSRSGSGQMRNSLASNASIDISLIGTAGTPPNPTAAFINIIATGATANGALKIGLPQDSPSALAPLARFAAGQTSSTGLIARMGESGTIRITNLSAHPVDIVLDVEGYFTQSKSTAASGFVPASARALDTRTKSALGSRQSIDLPIVGLGDVPNNPSAVVVDITAVAPSAPGYLTAYRSGSTRPSSLSQVTFSGGSTQSNLAVVSPSAAGKITIYNGSNAAVHVTVDVHGAFTRPSLSQQQFTELESLVRNSSSRVVDASDPAEVVNNGLLTQTLWTNFGLGMRTCMNYWGFAYTPPAFPATVASHEDPSPSDDYGITRSVENLTGVSSPNTQTLYFSSLSLPDQSSYARSLRGERLGTSFDPLGHDGWNEPSHVGGSKDTGGCEALVREVVVEPAVSAWPALGVDAQSLDDAATISESPLQHSLTAEWSSCMKSRGWTFGSLEQPYMDLNTRASGLLPAEPDPQESSGTSAEQEALVVDEQGSDDSLVPSTSEGVDVEPDIQPELRFFESIEELHSEEQATASDDIACRSQSGLTAYMNGSGYLDQWNDFRDDNHREIETASGATP